MLSVSYAIHIAKGMEMGFDDRMLIQKQGDGTMVFAGNLSRIGFRCSPKCGLLRRVFLRIFTVRAILQLLRRDGWVEVARRGSHRQFKHDRKAGRVTVPGKLSDDLAPGTLNSILKQAKLNNE
jgi:predicted RNA binding protein YcfA (HicA-like mRNA interferase family)